MSDLEDCLQNARLLHRLAQIGVTTLEQLDAYLVQHSGRFTGLGRAVTMELQQARARWQPPSPPASEVAASAPPESPE